MVSSRRAPGHMPQTAEDLQPMVHVFFGTTSPHKTKHSVRPPHPLSPSPNDIGYKSYLPVPGKPFLTSQAEGSSLGSRGKVRSRHDPTLRIGEGCGRGPALFQKSEVSFVGQRSVFGSRLNRFFSLFSVWVGL